jgi:ParB-like chromosome segregation protein Spo0J
VLRWADNNLLDLRWEEIGEYYGRYRLHVPAAERAMARSLERYGQLSPVVVCRRQDRYELIDGFKRLGAVRGLAQIRRLSARLMEADERTAKAAIYGLNRAGGRTRELEEAWIIQALVREDGLSQVEVAELLGRHKSWVCRRLALIERWGPTAKDELRVGLLTPTAARQIVRLPQGNQTEVLEAIRREALSSAELGGVVDLWLRCSERRQQEYLLAHPREALSQAKGGVLPAVRDPRLSDAGNQVRKRVGMLLDVLGRMEVWLAHQGLTGLTPEDRVILLPRFQRPARDAGSVAALSRDFVGELHATRSSDCTTAVLRSAGLQNCWESHVRAWPALWWVTKNTEQNRWRWDARDGRACWTRSPITWHNCWSAIRTSRRFACRRSCAGWVSKAVT